MAVALPVDVVETAEAWCAVKAVAGWAHPLATRLEGRVPLVGGFPSLEGVLHQSQGSWRSGDNVHLPSRRLGC